MAKAKAGDRLTVTLESVTLTLMFPPRGPRVRAHNQKEVVTLTVTGSMTVVVPPELDDRLEVGEHFVQIPTSTAYEIIRAQVCDRLPFTNVFGGEYDISLNEWHLRPLQRGV